MGYGGGGGGGAGGGGAGGSGGYADDSQEYPSLNKPPAGSIRFNTDSSKMEIYNGEKWWEIDSTSPAEQTGGTRGLLGGGGSPSHETAEIEFINIATTGNASSFGDLTLGARGFIAGGASRVRGVFAGGYDAPVHTNHIEFVTFASTGNSTDWGADLIGGGGRSKWSGNSNETRAVFFGGHSPSFEDDMQYITIASQGTAVLDFGDLSAGRLYTGAAASPTRGLIIGGMTPSKLNIIQYIEFSTTANALDFGDLRDTSSAGSACSNAVRAVYHHGSATTASNSNVLDYITIATLGNSVDFGDLTTNRNSTASCSSSTRGVWAGGSNPGNSPATKENTIDYVQIMTTGNAVDFGDTDRTTGTGGSANEAANMCGISNGHGGLG